MRTEVDLYVSPEADLEKVRDIMDKIARNSDLVDINSEFIVVAKENLDITGVITINMQMKCRIKDSRTEEEFETYFIIETNKAFKQANISRSVKPAKVS